MKIKNLHPIIVRSDLKKINIVGHCCVMKKKLMLFLGAWLLTSGFAQCQEVWTIGPMLHINFGGGEKRSTSFGIETAYWNLKSFPYSADFGVEFDRGKIRLYSEAQTGIGVAGISIGPVVEFNTKERNTKLGIQGSLWANYFIGLDYRIRSIDRHSYHAFGTYGKLPIARSGFRGGNSSGWGSLDDWD